MLLAFWNASVSLGICIVLWIFWMVTGYEKKSFDEQDEDGRCAIILKSDDVVVEGIRSRTMAASSRQRRAVML